MKISSVIKTICSVIMAPKIGKKNSGIACVNSKKKRKLDLANLVLG